MVAAEVANKDMKVTAVPTAINTADAGTKCLSKSRLKALKFLMKMINGDDEKIGKEEYDEIQLQEDIKKNTSRMARRVGANARVAAIIAMTLIGRSSAVEEPNMMHERNEASVEEDHWSKVFVTVMCLAMLGALSLAWWIREAWLSWFEVKSVETEEMQTQTENEEVENEKDDEIKRLQQMIKEKDVHLLVERRTKEDWMRNAEARKDEVQQTLDNEKMWKERYYGMMTDMQEERQKCEMLQAELQRQADQMNEMRKAAEVDRRRGTIWKERAEEAKAFLSEARKGPSPHEMEVRKNKVERLKWCVTPYGDKYHKKDCTMIKGQYREYGPCACCVTDTIRAVLDGTA